MQALIKQKTNLRKLGVYVDRLNIGGNRVIVKTCRESHQKHVDQFSKALKGLKVWAPEKRKPSVILKDVPEEVKKDTVIAHLADQNGLKDLK